jgi:putative salt-induced outer membrane protein YdiY
MKHEAEEERETRKMRREKKTMKEKKRNCIEKINRKIKNHILYFYCSQFSLKTNTQKFSFLFLLSLSLCLFQLKSEAQIVNIENQRLKGNKDGLTGNFDLNFSIIQNTKSIFQFGNRNKLNYKHGHKSYLLLTDILLVKSAREDFANSGFEHFRYAYNVEKYPFLSLEAFQQAQYNRVQLINLRLLTGGGARFKVLDKDSAAVNVGTFLMGEYEEQTDHTAEATIRWSLFISFDFQFNKHIGFNCITYYQPGFIDPFDFRVNTEASFRMKITEKLQFRLTYNLIYDSNPPANVPNSNYILSNAFSYVL